MRRLLVLAALAALSIFLIPIPSLGEERTWEDAMARTISLEVPAGRVVSLSPSVTEIIFAIGGEDSLAGVSKHCDYPVAAKLKPKAGDFNSPDVEAVGKISPDVVLFTEYARTEDLEALEKLGVTSFGEKVS